MRSNKISASKVIRVNDISTMTKIINSSVVKNVLIEFHNNIKCRIQAELQNVANKTAETIVGPKNLKCSQGGSQFGCTYPPNPRLV